MKSWDLTRAIGILTAFLAANAVADKYKANNTLFLNQPASWTSNAVPGSSEFGVWDATVAALNITNALGADLIIGGIKILNPGGPVFLTGSNTLTLNGVSGIGIDLSSASQDLTVNCPLTVASNQDWTIGGGRTLKVDKVIVYSPMRIGGAGQTRVNEMQTMGVYPAEFTGPSRNEVGPVSGPGSVVQSVSGTLALTGNSSYTGPTLINSGTLELQANSGNILGGVSTPLGTNTLTLSNNTTLALQADTNVTFAGGGQPNLYGNVTIAVGSLSAGVSNQTVSLGAPALLCSGASNTVTFAGSTNGYTLDVGVFKTHGGPLVVETLGLDVHVAGISSNGVFPTGYKGGGNGPGSGYGSPSEIEWNFGDSCGPIMGVESFTKSGPKRLTLTGTNSYSGATIIRDGPLVMNGALLGGGPVTVTGGGTLGGTGTITGPVTVQSGATLSPGIGIGWLGRLTINNTLSLSGNTVMELHKAAGTNDQVRGITTLTYGGTLVVTNLAGTLAAGDSFKLFDATSYSGSFATISPAAPGIGITWDASLLAVSGTLRVVSATPSAAKDILTFSFGALGSATVSGTNISLAVPCVTDVTALAPTYTVSPFATGAPASGSVRNFTTPQAYTVTAEDGSTKAYTVTVTVVDTTPPLVLSVSADCTSNKVCLTFSEPVAPASATTTANYAIDHGVVVLSALLGPPNTVCLFTTPLTFGVTYRITINGVRDLCGNVIADNTQIRFSCPTNGSLSGQKFNDLNGNGLWDAGEPALSGWTIHLSNGQTATTDASGYYYFMNLVPGTYTVSEGQQSGWVQTAPAGVFYTVALGQSQATNGLNFGNYTNCCVPPWNPTNCCTNCTAPFPFSISVTVLPGWNFLVNPLCHGMSNTVGELLPNVPDGTELMKWNVASQAYDPAITFDSGFGGWVDPNLRLEPGEGFLLSNPGAAYTLTFVGCEPDLACKPCGPTNVWWLRGQLGAEQGEANWWDLFRCLPECGTELRIWNGTGYVTYTYLTSWDPTTPSWPAGQSVFVSVQPNPNCTNGCPPHTYTLDADFDLGTSANLNHSPAHNQLQLNAKTKPLPYLAVACSTRGTVVRIDVNTGQVLGEYLSAPAGMGRNPSRTTVDKFGNVWVGNRAEYGSSGGQSKGSVVRIGLIIGGIRGDKINGVFVPNSLTGQYIQNPTYSTCVDRDNDGLIKTSHGLGDILTWNNTANADSNGGVSTAEDEAITIYTRVNGTSTRFVSVDSDNNVWTGGYGGARDFQKLDGTTGLPVTGAEFHLGYGGYGGLLDGNGVLWSANNPMLRFVPDSNNQPGVGTSLPISCYGVGINPLDCHIFVSSSYYHNSTNRLGVAELDPATGNVLNSYPTVDGGQGICVDGNGHVWVARFSQVAHLAPNGNGLGHFFVGYVSGFQCVTGVAEDSNGRIWATDQNANQAVAIDPTAGGPGYNGVPIGTKMAGPLTVSLGTGAGPYNYSDMTGAVLLGATSRSGFWDIIHQSSPGSEWGIVSWNAQTPAGSSLTVEVRAADNTAALQSKLFTAVGNSVPFCGQGINGQYLEVRVNFSGASCSTISPILYDLTVQCCTNVNHRPAVECPEPVVVCPGGSSTVTLTAAVSDADGDAVQVSWREGNNPPYQVSTIPAGGPPSSGSVTFTHTYSPGPHIITVAVNDGTGFHDRCAVQVAIGDITPPDLNCPPGISVTAFQGAVPDFRPASTVTDNCTATPAILLTQSPPPGTSVFQGSHPVTLTATDASGNSSTCQTFYKVSVGIVIINPTNYAIFTAPTNITLLADVPTNAGPVQVVRFLKGGTIVGTATNRPYGVTVRIDVPGVYPFLAQAVSPAGIVSTSDQIQLFVNGLTPTALSIINPRISGGMFSFSMATTAGTTYYIESSDSLTPVNWQALETVAGSGGVQTMTYSTTNVPQRFYRVRVP